MEGGSEGKIGDICNTVYDKKQPLKWKQGHLKAKIQARKQAW